MKYAIFDGDGRFIQGFNDAIHADIPAEAVSLTEEQWSDLVEFQGLRRWNGGSIVEVDLPPPAAPAVRVYKAPLFRTMTDAEYDAYLQIRAGFTPRLQAIFDAAEYLSSDDEFWPDLVAAAEQVYGAERAAELLAPTA